MISFIQSAIRYHQTSHQKSGNIWHLGDLHLKVNKQPCHIISSLDSPVVDILAWEFEECQLEEYIVEDASLDLTRT